jgi:hypothetical protein
MSNKESIDDILDGVMGDLDKKHEDKEAALKPGDLESLLPTITDQETYDKMIEVVKEANEKNLQGAGLVGLLNKVGGKVLNAAKKLPGV